MKLTVKSIEGKAQGELEVRVPLVDAMLWRQVAGLAKTRMRVDKAALAGTPRTPLPREVLDRPKTGFVVPTREWISSKRGPQRERGLRGWAREVYERYWKPVGVQEPVCI